MASYNASTRQSRRSRCSPQRIQNLNSQYDGKFLLFFIRRTKSYHNFSRGSLALQGIRNSTTFVFGQDYPLALQGGIYSGMFIAAASSSRIIQIENRLDQYISEHKENANLSEGVQAHMRSFVDQPCGAASSSSEDSVADREDDSDEDASWLPSHNVSMELEAPSPMPSQGLPSGPSLSSNSKSSRSATKRVSGSTLGTGNAAKKPRSQGATELQLSNVRTGTREATINSEQALEAIQAEQRRGLPRELLNESIETSGSGVCKSSERSEFLTREEFHTEIDKLKRFIAHKLKKSMAKSASQVHQPKSSDFLNEEFTGYDGRQYTLMDFNRSTTSKFIRAYACAKFGTDYVLSHIFGLSPGASSRKMASSENIEELKRVLNKVFQVPKEQAASAWTAVKDSLNRMGPEASFRNRHKKKTGDGHQGNDDEDEFA